ncbi:inositol monophosphatase family protein [Nakamurella sp.]|uniref:inositol monophosphatase family protein n=1 Tax=Nakamurella sp. TaxID=1869182 RepID=UPI003B3B049F
MTATLSDPELAADLVTTAGRLAARMRAEGLRVEEKTSISDVVSDADKAAEALIVERLAAERPADGVLGEEGAAAPGRRTWVIDPVDGTYNFVSGLPAWCSALALVDGPTDGPADTADTADTAGEDVDPVRDLALGAIYQATTDELWLGGPAVPPTLNGAPLPRIVDRELAEVAITTYLHPPRLRNPTLRDGLVRAIAGAASVRIIGSGSIELAAVAAGRLGVWLHADPPLWDWLPGAALVLGLGGTTAVFEYGGHTWHAAGPATAVAQARAAVLGSS